MKSTGPGMRRVVVRYTGKLDYTVVLYRILRLFMESREGNEAESPLSTADAGRSDKYE